MPVGRIYQAPTVTVVPRETPVYGYNGIKSRLPPLDTSIKPFHRKPSNQSIKQSSPAPQFKSRSPVPGIKSASPLRTLKSPSPGRCDNAGSSRSDFSEKPCIREPIREKNYQIWIIKNWSFRKGKLRKITFHFFYIQKDLIKIPVQIFLFDCPWTRLTRVFLHVVSLLLKITCGFMLQRLWSK